MLAAGSLGEVITCTVGREGISSARCDRGPIVRHRSAAVRVLWRLVALLFWHVQSMKNSMGLRVSGVA